MVRPAPLPVKQAVSIETRSFSGSWEPLTKPWHVIKVEDNPELRGVVVNGLVYVCVRLHDILAPGHIAYAVSPPQPAVSLADNAIEVEAG
jgi:hypothetical protein